jgi:hypothetical protein
MEVTIAICMYNAEKYIEDTLDCVLAQTMGSGTAFVAAGLLSIYFMQGRYVLLAMPIFIGVYFILQSIDNESFNRAQNISSAFMAMDEISYPLNK